MTHKRTFDLPNVVGQPPCMHLRSKEIYVTGNPDPIDPEDFDAPRYSCWCNKTQHVIGPDEQIVERVACVAGRDCFKPRQ